MNIPAEDYDFRCEKTRNGLMLAFICPACGGKTFSPAMGGIHSPDCSLKKEWAEKKPAP